MNIELIAQHILDALLRAGLIVDERVFDDCDDRAKSVIYSVLKREVGSSE